MGTKLNNVSRHWLTKGVALAAICFLLCLSANFIADYLVQSANRSIVLEGLFERDYLKTEDFRNRSFWAAQGLNSELYQEDDHSQLQKQLTDFSYYAKLGDEVLPSGISESEMLGGGYEYIKFTGKYASGSSAGVDQILFEGFSLPYDQNYIEENTYYVYDDEGVLIEGTPPEDAGANSGANSVIYVGLSKASIAVKNETLSFSYTTLKQLIQGLLITILSAIVLIIFMCIGAGRKSGDGELHMQFIDRLPSDITLAALGAAICLFASAAVVSIVEMRIYAAHTAAAEFGRDLLIYGSVIIGVAVAMWLFLSLVRKGKNRTLFRHSIIAMSIRFAIGLIKGVKSFFVNAFDGRPYKKYYFSDVLFRRRRNLILISAANFFLFCLLVWVFIGVFFLLFEIYIIYRYIRSNNEIYSDMGKIMDQVNEIEQGNLTYNPTIMPTSPLRPCSDKLLNISNGMRNSVEKQMGSERTKIELVTNVSHDLKTPLTSIIGYIDLLQKEELPPEAMDYVNILAQKSEKLKHIVSDVFELAKSTGGNLEMTREALDFKKLVEQNMADLEDKIEASGLAVRISMPEEPVNIVADGRRLTRVLQNIMDNALNYSLHGSRIYVTLKENGMLTIQNTASYEMEFTASEITERFVRGDKNRTMGGSGLGLSIAQSFAIACGGTFDVFVDGDQFKVTIGFDSNKSDIG